MANRTRTKAFTMRMSDDESQLLTDLADHLGLSASDIIRQCIRRQHAEVFGPPPPKRRKGTRGEVVRGKGGRRA